MALDPTLSAESRATAARGHNTGPSMASPPCCCAARRAHVPTASATNDVTAGLPGHEAGGSMVTHSCAWASSAARLAAGVIAPAATQRRRSSAPDACATSSGTWPSAWCCTSSASSATCPGAVSRPPPPPSPAAASSSPDRGSPGEPSASCPAAVSLLPSVKASITSNDAATSPSSRDCTCCHAPANVTLPPTLGNKRVGSSLDAAPPGANAPGTRRR